MTKEDMMIKWRKQRKVMASPSEIGQRPLYESTVNSDESQPSAELAFCTNESITCCKHGFKCSEYYNQKFDKKKISSLWPISELIGQFGQATNWMKTTPASSTISKSKESYATNNDQTSRYTNNQYDNIFVRCNDLMEKTAKTLSNELSIRQEPLLENNAAEMFPENAEKKLEVLSRFYLGQRSRSASIPMKGVAQNFRLYHELPENVSNLDNLKHYAPLYIIFVNNDLEYRHLPVQECFVNGKRRLFVECDDKNILLFKKLEYLVRHYANTFAYIDSQGRRSRFPDNSTEESILKLTTSSK